MFTDHGIAWSMTMRRFDWYLFDPFSLCSGLCTDVCLQCDVSLVMITFGRLRASLQDPLLQELENYCTWAETS